MPQASKRLVRLCVGVLCATSPYCVLHAQNLPQQGNDSILYVVLKLPEDAAAQVLYGTIKSGRSPIKGWQVERVDDLRHALQGRDDRALATVLDAKGVPTFLGEVPIFHTVRGEFHHAESEFGGWEIQKFEFASDERFAVVRAPADAGRVFIIETGGDVFRVDLNDVEPVIGALNSTGETSFGQTLVRVDAALGETMIDNHVDLLILGDGYRLTEQAKFFADAQEAEAAFFSLTPYAEYRNYVRVTKLFVASDQSGADHPPYNPSCVPDDKSCCADPTAEVDPLAGTYVATALHSRYCAFNTHRLLVPDFATVLAVASEVPAWDQILLIVNDETYGGSGNTRIAVSSLEPSAIDVARHEYGHSFTGLADEYDDSFPGFPGCSDQFGPACEANVTDETSAALIKWAPWIEGWVPIPTPEGDSTYQGQIGLFEGARYQAVGMYRPRDTQCLMHFLGVGFDQVCTQEYVLRLYRGGWGEPVSGISLIVPGSEAPEISSFRKCSGALLFSVNALAPVGGPSSGVLWSVNGNSTGVMSESFDFFSSGEGLDEVSVTVSDVTPFVHPAMAGGELSATRSWTVETVLIPATISLIDREIAVEEVFEACDSIAVGPSVAITATGDARLHAGRIVSVGSGFRVESGGRLEIRVGPVFPDR